MLPASKTAKKDGGDFADSEAIIFEDPPMRTQTQEKHNRLWATRWEYEGHIDVDIEDMRRRDLAQI